MNTKGADFCLLVQPGVDFVIVETSCFQRFAITLISCRFEWNLLDVSCVPTSRLLPVVYYWQQASFVSILLLSTVPDGRDTELAKVCSHGECLWLKLCVTKVTLGDSKALAVRARHRCIYLTLVTEVVALRLQLKRISAAL